MFVREMLVEHQITDELVTEVARELNVLDLMHLAHVRCVQADALEILDTDGAILVLVHGLVRLGNLVETVVVFTVHEQVVLEPGEETIVYVTKKGPV